jgi:hypothetical protein
MELTVDEIAALEELAAAGTRGRTSSGSRAGLSRLTAAGLSRIRMASSPIKFVCAAYEARNARRHPNERSRRRLQCLRTSFRSGKDTAPALFCVSDANKVLIDVWREQTEQRGVLATQDDHASMFRALGSIRLKARELHSSVRRLLVVPCEQHNEVSSVLNGLVHLLDEVRSNRNVVVLNENPVALLGENVGHLLRNSGHRASTAQEEVVSLTGTAWHRGDPHAQQQWSGAECEAVKEHVAKEPS